ncbi:DNA recombination protein RmuC [Nautilia lithotrophica]
MENIYLLLGIIGVLAVVFLAFALFIKKKNTQLLNMLNEKEEIINELAANLQYEKTQGAIKEEQVKNLNEYKTKYETIEKEFFKNKEMLKEIMTKYEESQKQLSDKNIQLEKLEDELKRLNMLNSELQVENRDLKTRLEESEKAFEEKLELLKKSEEKLKTTFENLANEILEKTNEKMTKTSKENLLQILNPLQNQMKEFKEKIEFLSKDEAEKISALQNELKNLKELSHKLSTDAENLTKALKGESKTQGNWGEMVLERVLELSGLEKGREYEREVSLNDEDNRRYRPDVIVHLPNSRDVIIDAKTSLNAYQEYIKTEDKTFIKAHIQALKKHIDDLAEKRYENLKGVNSLDFIFMFVPVENALLLALENDPGLFEYAFKKRVVLVSPTTLLVSLRAIESSWRFERQAKNIDEVVKAAESLYDKVRGFTEDFEKIGKSLESAQKSFDNAKNKLTSGRGNVLRQVELLKEKAGIKPKKEISKDLTDTALIETSENS